MDDRVAARVTGAASADMEPLAEEIGPAFQPPTQVQTSSPWDAPTNRAYSYGQFIEPVPEQLTLWSSIWETCGCGLS